MEHEVIADNSPYCWTVSVAVLAEQYPEAVKDGVVWCESEEIADRVAAAETARTGTPHKTFLCQPPVFPMVKVADGLAVRVLDGSQTKIVANIVTKNLK